jgi:voltage-dependent calcium channel alpha-2/delta-3
LPRLETNNIANFSAVLTKAFEILENFRTEKLGACCNQAIMLVSDGVPYNYEDVFETYNWKNGSLPEVRMFTYLIGKEIADVSKIKWMACANRGKFIQPFFLIMNLVNFYLFIFKGIMCI